MKNRGNIHSDFREDGAPVGLQERLYGDESQDGQQKADLKNCDKGLKPSPKPKWLPSLLIVLILLGFVFYSL